MPAMDTKPLFLPLKLAATALRVKASDLRAEADAGRLPFTKIGNEYVFDLRELERVITKRTTAVAHG